MWYQILWDFDGTDRLSIVWNLTVFSYGMPHVRYLSITIISSDLKKKKAVSVFFSRVPMVEKWEWYIAYSIFEEHKLEKRDYCAGLQMIPGAQMISKFAHKWTSNWLAKDSQTGNGHLISN